MKDEIKQPGQTVRNVPPAPTEEPASYRVHDLPARQRPREILDRCGIEAAPDETLLAVLLRVGVRGLNVMELARRLLKQYGSLSGLARTSVDDLARVRGMGRVKAQVLKSALELARRLAAESLKERPAVRSPEDAARLLRDQARTLEVEVFWALRLNSKNRLIGDPVEITRGLLDSSLAHAREIFREAVRSSSAALILAHNHPSGDPAPSAEDIRITRQLVQAGRVLEIRVLDHVIIGKASPDREKDYCSLREAGIVEFG